jgi:predicted nucleotidyltransferase component of viral defense system
MLWSDLQCVELFHLHVLGLLGTGPDKAHFALKGGCNLRFYFGSVRYSEDMDLDVDREIEPHALRERMDRLLSGSALASALRAKGVEVTRVSAPKQTDTTQRWKAQLTILERPSAPLHTKIEFSRRAPSEEAVLGAILPEVAATYQTLPLLVRHYPLDAALRQKVRALVGRMAVQARDVFDLALLLSRTTDVRRALEAERETLPRAIERAMDVSFDDYRGQVVAYLHPDHAPMYASRQAWDLLQNRVVEMLEKASP